MELTAAELRRRRGRAGTRGRRGGCWRLRWCWRAWTGRPRRGPAGWIGRRSGTGCTATTPRGWPGSRTSRGAARPRRLVACGARRARVVGRGRSRPGAGGGRGGALAAAGPARADRGALRGGLARADGRQVPGGARLSAALGAPAAPEGRSRGPGALSKKLPRGGSRGDPRSRARQAARDLVPGRGASRPAGHAHPGLGDARHAAAGAARHPLPVGLHLRRGLPGARRRAGLVCPSPTPRR